jgi:hypothetical protein
LDFAKAQGSLSSRRKSGSVEGQPWYILPSQAAVKKVKHHAAMPHAEVGALMAKLATGMRSAQPHSPSAI